MTKHYDVIVVGVGILGLATPGMRLAWDTGC